MYYRVAIRVDAAPTWQWKSTVLSELSTLFHFLRLFRALPHDQLRVFSSSERAGLAEQLEQENQGLSSPSVTAAQFLRERMLRPPSVVRSISEHEGGTELQRGAIAVISQPVNDAREQHSCWTGSGARRQSALPGVWMAGGHPCATD
jgi:hypothetical protein